MDFGTKGLPSESNVPTQGLAMEPSDSRGAFVVAGNRPEVVNLLDDTVGTDTQEFNIHEADTVPMDP